jgi:diguanylate cyclase (GGDEF)-like protein/PAS domain S-box-containing protein
MYGLPRARVQPGVTVPELVELRLAAGTFFKTDPAQYTAALMSSILERKPTRATHELADGRVITVVNQPIADGGWVVTHEDVSERTRASRELERTRNFLRTVIENVPAAILVKDARDLSYALINREGERLFGISRKQAIGQTVRDIFSTAAAATIDAHDRQALAGRGSKVFAEHPVLTPGADNRIVTTTRVPIMGEDSEPKYLLTVVHDVTDRWRAERALESTRNFLDTVIENVPAAIVVKDAHDFRYVLMNREGERIYGMSREEAIGKTAQDIFPPDAAAMIAGHDRELLEHRCKQSFDEHPMRVPGEASRIVLTTRLPIMDEHNEPKYLLTVIQDVTERKRTEARIARLAHYDSLTDLPNRAAFNECFTSVLERAAASGESFAVLSVDLDRFQEINDVFGHSAGDRLLRAVAERLSAAVEGAFLARVGGDEFAAIVTDVPVPTQTARLGERLLAAVAEDFEFDGQCVRIGLSAGIALYPLDGTDATSLIGNADAALYRAKADGRGALRYFEPEMDYRLRERRALLHDLRSAVERGEFVAYYQPQAKIDGEVIGFEALARWHHPTRGEIPPATFIPIAEESGVVPAIGEWMLREACREAASWPKRLHIAVNLSPVQFRYGDLVGLVHQVLIDSGLSPNRLELEITESVLIDDLPRALSILRRLKGLGVCIAMDDFGTGYSSLSNLQAFPFDKIKIDRSFISDLERSPQSATIVRAVIALGRGLDLPVLAEGVETQSQLAFLSHEACAEVQGYLVGRPLPISNYAMLVGRAPAAQQTANVA